MEGPAGGASAGAGAGSAAGFFPNVNFSAGFGSDAAIAACPLVVVAQVEFERASKTYFETRLSLHRIKV